MYTFGRVTVSLECREVCVDGQPRYIGARAFEILELLVKAAGKLVSKDEIMEAVWPDTIVVENNIQVHISTLRKLFGGKHGWIRTESGRGPTPIGRRETAASACLRVSTVESVRPVTNRSAGGGATTAMAR